MCLFLTSFDFFLGRLFGKEIPSEFLDDITHFYTIYTR